MERIHIDASERNEFQEKGYLIIRGSGHLHSLIQGMRDEVQTLGALFMDGFSFDDGAEMIAALDPKNRRTFYHGLRYLPSTTQLACSPILLQISRQLNLQQPAVMHSYNLRMDMPNEPKYMFHWHQDISYLLGSKNSVTYWIPITPVNSTRGSIELIDGSHLNGLTPFHYTGSGPIPPNKSMSPSDIHLDEEPASATTLIEADPGDIVVFSQLLLHRSTPNASNKTRWVAQVRHADLSEQAFLDAGYPFGDYTNIFQTDYLKAG